MTRKSFQIQYMLEVTIINPWIKWPFTSLSQGVKNRLSPPLNERCRRCIILQCVNEWKSLCRFPANFKNWVVVKHKLKTTTMTITMTIIFLSINRRDYYLTIQYVSICCQLRESKFNAISRLGLFHIGNIPLYPKHKHKENQSR